MWNKILALLMLVSPLLLAQDSTKEQSSTHKYVGVDVCGACHKSEKQGNQLGIWKGTQHSKAFQALQTDKANKIALDKGFKTAAAETPECLKCHVSGNNVDASMKEAKFKVEDGVQCETCHGPGSDYKNMKVMKNKDDAIANGLKMYSKVEDLCVKCHNSESPTFVKFDFAAQWDKIKHPVPAADKK